MIAYRILLEEPPTRSLEYAVSDYSGNPIELWRYCIQNPAIKGRSLGNVSWVGVEKLIKLFIRGSHKENVPHVRLYLVLGSMQEIVSLPFANMCRDI